MKIKPQTDENTLPISSTSPPPSPSPSQPKITPTSSLPSIPSLQFTLSTATTTVTHSLSTTITLPSSITSLSLSPSPTSSSLYASSGPHINVYVYEHTSATWTLLETITTNSTSSGSVKSIAFSGENLLTAHQDGKIRVWKVLDNGKHKFVSSLPTLTDRLMNFPLPKNHVKVRRHKLSLWLQHNDAVSALSVANSSIYSVSWDKTLKIWSPTDLRCRESVTASEDAVNAVAVSGDGVVYTGSADGRIKVWSGKSKKKHELVATLEKHKSTVNELTLTGDGSVLFSGACDRSILVWERVDNLDYMGVSGALRGHEGAILCLISVSDFLVSGSADRTVRIWRRGNDGMFCCLAVLTGHKKAVKCLDARMEGDDEIMVFSGGLDGEINVWSVKINQN